MDFNKIRERHENEFNKSPYNLKKNQSYLLVCLYTLIQPIKLQYKNMRIYQYTPNQVSENYINLELKEIKLRKETIKIPDNLFNIIKNSIKMFPRKYILSSFKDGDRPIGKQGIEKLIKYSFQDISPNMTINMLRSKI